MVVNRAYDRLGVRIHGREGVDDRHPGTVAVVQGVADPGLGQPQTPRSRGGPEGVQALEVDLGPRSRPTKWTREAASWPCCGTDPPPRAARLCGRVKNAF